MQIAQEFYERLIRLKQTWIERKGKSNVLSGQHTGFMRRVIRQNIQHGPSIIADRVLMSMNILY